MKQPFESFQHMLSAMAGTYPDRTALVDNECEITYRRLETEAPLQGAWSGWVSQREKGLDSLAAIPQTG